MAQVRVAGRELGNRLVPGCPGEVYGADADSGQDTAVVRALEPDGDGRKKEQSGYGPAKEGRGETHLMSTPYSAARRGGFCGLAEECFAGLVGAVAPFTAGRVAPDADLAGPPGGYEPGALLCSLSPDGSSESLVISYLIFRAGRIPAPGSQTA